MFLFESVVSQRSDMWFPRDRTSFVIVEMWFPRILRLTADTYIHIKPQSVPNALMCQAASVPNALLYQMHYNVQESPLHECARKAYGLSPLSFGFEMICFCSEIICFYQEIICFGFEMICFCSEMIWLRSKMICFC